MFVCLFFFNFRLSARISQKHTS